MHILLCNDDGFQALGIQTLARVLQDEGHRVTIVAPSDERSGQSHAMSFFRPVLVKQVAKNIYSVYGTPADCAAIALSQILKNDLPELVVSGINHGLNVGWDVNYSGTVGAATEASLLGFRSIAVSMDMDGLPTREAVETGFERAAKLVAKTIRQIPDLNWPHSEVLNINHPGVEPKDVVCAECGTYNIYLAKIVHLESDEQHSKNYGVYMIGGSARRELSDMSQDVGAIQSRCVTLSFLQARQSSTANTDRLQSLSRKLLS